MCGIYGIVGDKAVEKTLQGIKKLEYRGYDSAGISFFNYEFKLSTDIPKYLKNISCFKNGLNIIREEGDISKLEKIINSLKPKSKLAIGHTRWATHGKPSIANSHPHHSENGDWVVVHNGIIENYIELKQELKGLKFYSETDSEIVAKMLSYNFDGDVLNTIKNVCSRLNGSYALAILYAKNPNKIYVAKSNSPCVVGYSKDIGIVCSDISSIEKIENLYVLPNQTIAEVSAGNINFFDYNLNKIELSKFSGFTIDSSEELGKYSHFMLKEINEIPTAIEKTVVDYNTIEKIRKSLPKKVIKNTKEILIIGCGTAYHAGLMGKRLLEEVCGIKTDVDIASEFRYKNYVPHKNTLAIFVSQSGETADTIKAVKLCKAYGLTTVAITNVKNSSICFEVDYCLYTNAGKEVAVASTKAYNCQVAMFYLMAAYFKAVSIDQDDLIFEEAKQLVDVAKQIKSNKINNICMDIAREIKDSKSLYMIGRTVDYYLSLEASLKLKEISYIHCEAYPAGELKHGTISLIDNDTFVFAFLTQKHLKDKTINNAVEVASRGGKVILFTNQKIENTNFYKIVNLPKLSEFYMPLLLVTYTQLIAYYTSVYLGNNPDKPRSLAKSVTVE